MRNRDSGLGETVTASPGWPSSKGGSVGRGATTARTRAATTVDAADSRATECDGVDAEIQALDVREAVNAVLLALDPQLVAKRLDSVADIPPDAWFAADPARLHGILLTLLSNAIRFTEPGGFVMIDVGYPEDLPGDVVMLRVGDSGCGIPVDRQEEIFESSNATRDLASPRSPSAAPGLATSRSWARAMGGDLRVRSEVARGSVFTLKLPRAAAS
jgi:signal transduction histidine kinase